MLRACCIHDDAESVSAAMARSQKSLHLAASFVCVSKAFAKVVQKLKLGLSSSVCADVSLILSHGETTHLHHLVQEGRWTILLQPQDLLERIHLSRLADFRATKRSTDLGAAIRHIVNDPLQPTPEHGDPFLLIRRCWFGRMSRPRRKFDCGMRRALWEASAIVR